MWVYFSCLTFYSDRMWKLWQSSTESKKSKICKNQTHLHLLMATNGM